ncbi:MAG: hypothetical protein HY231_05895 [Acidobacteria bacterium]|nr:hypothetical protein [Acidobacteriota bacterium]
MRYYIIGIGGTGAKCVEALTHLCAAGLMPEGELYTLFVDPDKANGSLERAEITLQQYTRCQQLKLGATDLFKTPVTVAKPGVWSPFNDANPTLEKFFRYTNLKMNDAGAAHLFDVLYSPVEKVTSLEKGFRGHPSIGAAVMANTLELGKGEPWKTFREKIGQDVRAEDGAKIILIGSIFGGTGASGVPTIARLIHNELKKIGQENAKVGGILMLPYFSFSPVTDEKLRADAEDFLLNTQAALKYYHQQDELGIYDAVYLLGEQELSPMKAPSIGGRSQRNEPHFMELYAALACLDFFGRKNPTKYSLVARQQASSVTWNDLPYFQGQQVLHQKLNQLARFAFAYLGSYYPMLEDIHQHGKGYRAPWYIDFFERRHIDLQKAMVSELLQVKEYCQSLLLWLANLQGSASGASVALINYNAFAQKVNGSEGGKEAMQLKRDFRSGDFDNLTLANPDSHAHALTRLWERVCNARVRDHDADGVGKFIHALYRECRED